MLLQAFTVSQNFTDVSFNDNIQLYGVINGYDLKEVFDDTVFKNNPVLLKHVVFGKFLLFYQ